MQAHKEFVPSRLITVPFMTILRERVYKETTDNLPYRSNFIYFVDQVLYAIEDLHDDRRPLKFNLKCDFYDFLHLPTLTMKNHQESMV